MAVLPPARRLRAFLTEDDRLHGRPVAELVVEQALELGAEAASSVTGHEGFGSRGHLRSERLPDLGRGLPVIVDVVGDGATLAAVQAVVAELAPGRLVVVGAARGV